MSVFPSSLKRNRPDGKERAYKSYTEGRTNHSSTEGSSKKSADNAAMTENHQGVRRRRTRMKEYTARLTQKVTAADFGGTLQITHREARAAQMTVLRYCPFRAFHLLPLRRLSVRQTTDGAGVAVVIAQHQGGTGDSISRIGLVTLRGASARSLCCRHALCAFLFLMSEQVQLSHSFVQKICLQAPYLQPLVLRKPFSSTQALQGALHTAAAHQTEAEQRCM